MNRYTTHLVCAPDDLSGTAQVLEWLVAPGSQVFGDQPLVRLALAEETRLVVAPLPGLLQEQCVAVGDWLDACELVAMLEAEEEPFGVGWAVEPDDAEASFSVPACRLGDAPARAAPAAPPATDALSWCAALGLAPEEIPCGPEGLSVTALQRHVRAELRRLAAMRELLSK